MPLTWVSPEMTELPVVVWYCYGHQRKEVVQLHSQRLGTLEVAGR